MPTNLRSKSCLIADNGLFVELAPRLARDFGEVKLFVPWISGYPKAAPAFVGTGIDKVERVESFWDHVQDADLVVFPDLYFANLARIVKDRLNKPVWSHFGAEALELDRWGTRRLQRDLGIGAPPTKHFIGVDALSAYLQTVEDKWIKISCYRGDCFDEKTEIFTESGWKRFAAVTEQDKVLSMDMDSREASFFKVSTVVKKSYSGDMVRLRSRSVDALVTPNHHFWRRSRQNSPWKYKSSEDLIGMSFSLPLGFRWAGNRRETYTVKYRDRYKQRRRNRETYIPRRGSGKRNVTDDVSIGINDWLEFLGWFVSEGYLYLAGPNRNKYKVAICQSVAANPEKYNEIRDLLARMPYNVQTEGDRGWSIYDKSLFMELWETCYLNKPCKVCGKEKCAHTKKVPDYVKTLPNDQIKIFLSTYALGDGCIESGERVRYYTSSIQLADDVQELSFKAGYSANICVASEPGDQGGTTTSGTIITTRVRAYVVNQSGRIDRQVEPKNISVERYNGMVYDVSVSPHHSIFVRRNGKAYWSGNSETWHHETWHTSAVYLDYFRNRVGALADSYEFIVEDNIDGIEIGYDGFTVKGEWPEAAYWGFEVKDNGYIGKFSPYPELPKPMREINEKLSPILKEEGAVGFCSFEFRLTKDGDALMIDPCLRAGSPPFEGLLEGYDNIAEIIWEGANGRVAPVRSTGEFIAIAMIHCQFALANWVPLEIPESIRRWVKLRNLAIIDNKIYHVPTSGEMPEIGAVVAVADDLEDAKRLVMERAEKIKGYLVECRTEMLEFAQEEIDRAKEFGIDF